MMTRRRLLTAASAAGLALNATGPVRYGFTQPGGKTARILVGFPPGGTTDVIARLLTSTMKGYASSIIVENRPGAGGRIAIEALKTAVPDGSVFLLTPAGPMTLYPHVYKSLKYDPLQDFFPVSTVSAVPYLLTVGPKVPSNVKTLGCHHIRGTPAKFVGIVYDAPDEQAAIIGGIRDWRGKMKIRYAWLWAANLLKWDDFASMRDHLDDAENYIHWVTPAFRRQISVGDHCCPVDGRHDFKITLQDKGF
jgi:hypothetical protein